LVLFLGLPLDFGLDLLLDFFLVLAMIPPASIYKQIVHTPLRRLKPDSSPASARPDGQGDRASIILYPASLRFSVP
jgi:hypothetical protein